MKQACLLKCTVVTNNSLINLADINAHAYEYYIIIPIAEV